MTTASTHAAAPRHRGAAWLLAAVVGMLVGLVAVTAWIGVRGMLAYGHLQDARETVATIVAGGASDADATAAAIRAAGDDARAAHDLTSDPVWRAAELLPWVGPQLAAVSALASTANDLAETTLGSVAEAATMLSPDAFRLVDGAIDVAAFERLQGVAAEAADGLATASASLSGIDRAPLVRPVREGLDAAAGQIDAAAATAATLERTTLLLPPMLGAETPRTWLLLVQNNAELRSLGGMPGATAVFTADRGRLTLAHQGVAVPSPFAPPVVDLDPELKGLYGTRPARWFSGTTILPDFAEAAPIAREMWKREHGVESDAVASIDPVALSYLLEATGPVTLPSGTTLTSDNAVDVLLNQVYLDYDPVGQNEVFAEATAAVFSALAAGSAEPSKLVAALGRAAEERRLLLWSSDADEQDVLDDTTLAGHLPVTDAAASRFGVYLNDGTGSKLGYYLDAQPEVAWATCPSSEAEGEATLTLTLRSDAPPNAGEVLPPSISGGAYAVPAGILRVVTYVYLPIGATLVAADVTDSRGFGGGAHDGHRVLQFTSDLAPGASETATIRVSLPATAPATLRSNTVQADITPAFGVTTVAASCEPGD